MGRKMRKLLVMVLVLMLMSSDLAVIAEALATLKLPSALQIIEEEAFYGNTSIEKVVVPEGTTEIGSKAFADSSLKEINLPESIEYIADDAFDGCKDVDMTTKEDTYAYDWAIKNGFITPVLNANPASDFEYTISDDEVTIYWYVGTSTEVVIPSVIDSCPVTSIYESAFEDCTSLTSIIIPDSVTNIGYSAFAYCTSLTSVILPNYLTSISEETFMGCKSLSSITIPSSVVSIGDWAFGYCTNLTSIEIPSSVINIGEGVFNNCSSLNEISVDENNTVYASEEGVLFSKDKSTLILYPAKKALQTYSIPQTVTCINEYAFEYCNTLISIEINGNDTSVGDYAFFGCSNLTNIKINGSLVSVGEAAFRNCDSLANITINGSIASIEEYAFEDCDSLVNIVINGGIASIGNSAFYDCDSIVNIVIPNGITSIGESAFSSCSRLANVKIHGSGVTIGSSAFSACTCLTSIELNGNVTSIGESAFAACANLTNIEIKGSIGSIGDRAFYDCSSLGKIILPAGVTSIGKYAFGYCYSLMRIVIPDSVIFIDSNAFWNCPNNYTIYGEVGSYVETYAGRHFVEYVYFNPDGDFDYSINNDEITIIRYAGLESEVIIPDTIANYPVTSIYDNAFSFCSATSITIPDGVTSIGFEAFFWCTSLTDINLPDSIISIGDDAFSCTDINNITIPNGVISIGNNAFHSCNCLSSISIPASVTSLGKSVFAFCGNLTSIIVDENNAVYSSIDGILFDRRKTELICYPEGKYANGYIIPDSVISIGDDAFSYHNELTSITIPDGVVHIGKNAFHSCHDLENITLPDSIRSIGENAFSNCGNLTSIVIPDGVTCINDYTFFSCTSLVSVLIPETVAKIGDAAFWNCWSLSNIQIPDNVTSIGESAFYYCNDLTNLQIPESVTTIGYSAFYECSSLISVVIPPSVTSIGEYAFLSCSPKLIIYGEAGSYAENYAKNNGIAFMAISNWNDDENHYSASGYTLTGSVVTSAGDGIEGVLVYLYSSNSEDAELIGSAMTNASGTWQINGLSACEDTFLYFYSNNYTVTNNGYSLDIQNSTILEPFVAELFATGDSTTTFTASATQVVTGEEVTFEVEALDATLVRLVVDGKAYENYYLTDGKATIKRAFSSSGNRSVQFQPHSLSGWGQISAPQIITVTSIGKLAKPNIHPIDPMIVWNGEEISWDAVSNADSYTVYLYHNDTLLWPGDNTQGDSKTSDTKIELPDDYLFEEGKYAVNVVTSGYNYDSSTGYASFIVRPTSEAVDITDYPANCDIGKTVTISVACYDKKMYTKVQVLDPNGNPVEVTAKDKNTYIFSASIPGAYKATAYASDEEGFAIENAQATSGTVTVTAGNPQILSVVDRWGQKYAVAYTDETTWVAATVNCEGTVEVFVDGVSKGILTPEEDNSSEYRYTVGNLPDGKHVVEFKVSYGGYSSETASINLYSITKASGDSRTRYASKPVQMETYPGSNYGYKLAYGDEVTLEGTYGANYSYVTDGTYWRFVKNEALVEELYTGPSDDGINLRILTTGGYIGDERGVYVQTVFDSFPENCYFEAGIKELDLYNSCSGDMLEFRNYYISTLDLSMGEYTLVARIMTNDGVLVTEVEKIITIYANSLTYQYHNKEFELTPLDIAFTQPSRWEQYILQEESIRLANDVYTISDVRADFAEMGFEKIHEANLTGKKGEDKVGYVVGKKLIVVDDVVKTLYVVVVRGTNNNYEWISNFNIGYSGDTRGFVLAAKDVANYLNTLDIDVDNSKIWFCGHSRGAAVANYLAGKWAPDIGFDPLDIYAYTFACPNVVLDASRYCPGIFNYNFAGDAVPMVPFEKGWGLHRYGRTITVDNGALNEKLGVVDGELTTSLMDIVSSVDRSYFYSKIYPLIREAFLLNGSSIKTGELILAGIGAFLCEEQYREIGMDLIDWVFDKTGIKVYDLFFPEPTIGELVIPELKRKEAIAAIGELFSSIGETHMQWTYLAAVEDDYFVVAR